MPTDIHWHIDGDKLYMEAVDGENGLALGQHEEVLQFWTDFPENGSFDVADQYLTEWPDVTAALNDFANFYREQPLYFNR